LTVQELDHKDSSVQLNVVRQQGFFGRVVVTWSASGDQSGLSDITPLSGQVSSDQVGNICIDSVMYLDIFLNV
jgi:hypothetical protein